MDKHTQADVRQVTYQAEHGHVEVLSSYLHNCGFDESLRILREVQEQNRKDVLKDSSLPGLWFDSETHVRGKFSGTDYVGISLHQDMRKGRPWLSLTSKVYSEKLDMSTGAVAEGKSRTTFDEKPLERQSFKSLVDKGAIALNQEASPVALLYSATTHE